jgi:hypothetical protein
VSGLAICGAALGAPPASEEAREIQARTLYAAGEYRQAVDIYAGLYAETLHPTYLRNVGRCFQNMGEPEKAISSFREYLRKAGSLSAQGRAEIEGYIREMEALITARRQSAARADSDELQAPVLVEEAPPLSHGGQLGAFVRADFGLQRTGGVVLLPGVSLGVSEAVELGAAAFLGGHRGVLATGRWFLAAEHLKPSASLGLLMLFPRNDAGERQTRPGLQAGAGLLFDATRHLGVSVEMTAAFFPGAPSDFGAVWWVPSLAVQGRL